MNRIPTAFEFIVAATISGLGIVMLSDGSSNRHGLEAVDVICGAFLLVFGAAIVVSMLKSAIRHRRLLKEHFDPH